MNLVNGIRKKRECVLKPFIVRKIDVRVVAATARNLVEMAEEKRFRDDLLYRLRVVHIEVPALRERTEDIPLLVGTLSARAAAAFARANAAATSACARTTTPSRSRRRRSTRAM